MRTVAIRAPGDLNEIDQAEIGDQTELFLHSIENRAYFQLENAAYFHQIRSTPSDQSDHNTATYPFEHNSALD